MCVVHIEKKCIEYYDSIRGDGINVMENVFQYVQDEHRQQFQCEIENKEEWSLINKDAPQQENGYDCGVFAIMFADMICGDLQIQFEQRDINSFRIKICHSIRTGKLWYCESFIQAV